jgi:hypothetical protein
MQLIDSIRERLRRHRQRRHAASQRVIDRIAQLERLLSEQQLRAVVRDAWSQPLLVRIEVFHKMTRMAIDEILRRCG